MANPVTVPPELIYEWAKDRALLRDPLPLPEYIAARAAQWGADQELEACCDWLSDFAPDADWPVDLLIARRPKPTSLKEQAMQALCRFMASEGHEDCTEEEVADDFTIIRRALEQLPDSEPSGNSR